MKVLYDQSEWNEKSIVATIGFFDGVHSGHCFLLQEMRKLAQERGLPTAIITFPVHPREVLQSDYQPKLLNSFDEKLELLSKTEIDYIIVMPFTHELAALTAFDFITTVLIPQWSVRTLFIGYDHRFGHQRTEGFEKYVMDGQAHGIEIIKMSSYFSDHGVAVSSSMVRRLIETGEMTAASRLLGYWYKLKGQVVSGSQMGRRLGFPTANIAVDEKFKVIPRNGSYAVQITIDDRKYKGMLYVGSRPTIVDDDSLSIEANIFDFNATIYNESIMVEFIDFIREDMKFDSLDELRKQLEADKKKSQMIWKRKMMR
jgi:riboflavin kinase/FMN adenylyltransferase